jgi:chromosome segregation ATPase
MQGELQAIVQTLTNIFSDDSKEIQSLKEELAELYKKRGKNDQLLIDAQNKITDMEATLGAVLDSKNKLEQQLKDAQMQLKKVEKRLKEIQEERDAISDEIITLKVTILLFIQYIVDLGRKQFTGAAFYRM